MSFISTPFDSSTTPIVVSKAFEASTASPGISVGDVVTRRQILDASGNVTTTSFFNETTGLSVAAPAASSLVELQDQLSDLVASNNSFKQTNAPQAINNALNTGSLLTEAGGRSIASLYVHNTGAVVGHYVGVVSGTAAVVSGTTPLLASFFVVGAANTQVLIDQVVFNTFANQNGFQIVRSSNPLIFTQLGAALAANQLIRVTSTTN